MQGEVGELHHVIMVTDNEIILFCTYFYTLVFADPKIVDKVLHGFNRHISDHYNLDVLKGIYLLQKFLNKHHAVITIRIKIYEHDRLAFNQIRNP